MLGLEPKTAEGSEDRALCGAGSRGVRGAGTQGTGGGGRGGGGRRFVQSLTSSPFQRPPLPAPCPTHLALVMREVAAGAPRGPQGTMQGN